jgi:hypothetical protein
MMMGENSLRVHGTDSESKFIKRMTLWASSTFFLTHVSSLGVNHVITAINNLASKSGGVSLAFRWAKSVIARHRMSGKATRCDTLVLAHSLQRLTGELGPSRPT